MLFSQHKTATNETVGRRFLVLYTHLLNLFHTQHSHSHTRVQPHKFGKEGKRGALKILSPPFGGLLIFVLRESNMTCVMLR